MPAAVLLGIQAFTALMAQAPQVASLLQSAKDFVAAAFTAKLITTEQQNLINDHLDSTWAMIQAGIVLPHWQVDPDPA